MSVTPEEHINLVKQRYGHLSLTDHQAQQVFQFEQENRFSSMKHYFSNWEELDYEWTTFKEILNEEQWQLFEQHFYQRKQSLENNFIEADMATIKELEFHQELLHYYKNNALPELLTHHSKIFDILFQEEYAKMQYLKNEYKKYLKENRRMTLTTHFRHYRTFRPNELKNSLLRHELSCVLPEYSYFKHQMDRPTRMIGKYLYKRIYINDEELTVLNNKHKELEAFSKSLLLKHHGPLNNVVYFGKLSPEEEKENHIMSLLLMDKDMYREL